MPGMRSMLMVVATSLALASSALAEVKVDRVPCPGGGQCVRLANGTTMGLVAYVYTGDLAKGLRVAERLESGMVGLNKGIVSDPAAPFGGVKESGIGRELGMAALDLYTETKNVFIDLT